MGRARPTLWLAVLLAAWSCGAAKEGTFDVNFGDMGTLVLAVPGEPSQARGAVVYAPRGGRQLIVLGTSNATALVWTALKEDGAVETGWGHAGLATVDVVGASLNAMVAHEHIVVSAGADAVVALRASDGVVMFVQRVPGFNLQSVLLSVDQIVASGVSVGSRNASIVWLDQRTGTIARTAVLERSPPDETVTILGSCQYGNGRLMLVGATIGHTQHSRVLLLRVTATGEPDATFGANGVVLVDYPNSDSETAMDCVVQPDQRALVGGQSDQGAFVMRVDATGALDRHFGSSNDGHSCVSHGCGVGCHSDDARAAFVPQATAFRSLLLLPSLELVALAEKSNRLIVAKFSAPGVLDTAFGFRRGLTEKTFGAATDVAFGGQLLLDASMRYWATGWARLTHETEISVMRFEGPAHAMRCDFGTADACVCIADKCLVQGASPVRVTHALEPLGLHYTVSGDLLVEGLRWKDAAWIGTHGTVSFTNASTLVMDTPMIGAYTPFAESQCLGRFGAVVLNQTSHALRACQQFVAAQRLVGNGQLVIDVSIGRIDTPACGGGGGGGGGATSSPASSGQGMSTAGVVAVVMLAVALSAVGVVFVSFLIRKYRMEGSRSLKAKSIKMAATNEYKRMI